MQTPPNPSPEDATPNDRRPRVVIAGATGFVGRALAARLSATCEVIALTRRPRVALAHNPNLAVQWQACDLFSLLDAERAMEGADYAFYLVHSMQPSARLTQARFEDLDLILADNFARAASRAGVKQTIYLGGIVPDWEQDTLSTHLRSRLEMERALGAYNTPVTSLRAGMVVGPGGASFEILRRLVERLPAMVLPAWTATPMTPIDLSDTLDVLVGVMGDEALYDVSGNIGGADTLTYHEMILQTAELVGVSRPVVNVPVFSPGLSALWVSLVTQTSQALVKPLVGSLTCPMVAGALWIQEHLELAPMDFRTSMSRALSAPEAEGAADEAAAGGEARGAVRPGPSRRPVPNSVRSVQRLPFPRGGDAHWVAAAYAEWLPDFMWPLIQVERPITNTLHFKVGPVTLLELSYAEDRSYPDRPLFYVTGGVLADTRNNARGRLEFRPALGDSCIIAAIHDFTPRLPWPLYLLTQAQAHAVVMYAFGRYLERVDRISQERAHTATRDAQAPATADARPPMQAAPQPTPSQRAHAAR